MKSIRFSLILFCFWLISIIPAFSQAPPPPPDGAKGGSSNKAPGGGAPVDAGLVTMVLMVAGYGGFKWVDARRREGSK
jgi:hypothetical protein